MLCIKSKTGRAFCPTAQIASEKNIAKTTICNKLPSASALKILVGTKSSSICENEWSIFTFSMFSTALIDMVFKSMSNPAPGCKIFALKRPIINANVVAISK